MRRLLPVLFAASWLALGCPPEPTKPTPPTPREDDAGPYIPSPDACASACAKLADLGCPESKQVPGGKSCEDICRQAEESGQMRMKPDCIATSKSVEDARACGSVRCRK